MSCDIKEPKKINIEELKRHWRELAIKIEKEEKKGN